MENKTYEMLDNKAMELLTESNVAGKDKVADMQRMVSKSPGYQKLVEATVKTIAKNNSDVEGAIRLGFFVGCRLGLEVGNTNENNNVIS